MLASCDAKYNFILIDVGAEGRNSDGGIFKTSDMGKALENQSLKFPNSEPLSKSRREKIPYYMVADEAFPLKSYMMRPYPGRSTGLLPLQKAIFNYRLSRARRVSENTFGIWSARFRIFRKPIVASKETVQAVTLASVVLHNYIKSFDDQISEVNYRYVTSETLGSSRNTPNCLSELQSIEESISEICEEILSPEIIRNTLSDYFMNEGAVPWQRESVLFGCH